MRAGLESCSSRELLREIPCSRKHQWDTVKWWFGCRFQIPVQLWIEIQNPSHCLWAWPTSCTTMHCQFHQSAREPWGPCNVFAIGSFCLPDNRQKESVHHAKLSIYILHLCPVLSITCPDLSPWGGLWTQKMHGARKLEHCFPVCHGCTEKNGRLRLSL